MIARYQDNRKGFLIGVDSPCLCQPQRSGEARQRNRAHSITENRTTADGGMIRLAEADDTIDAHGRDGERLPRRFHHHGSNRRQRQRNCERKTSPTARLEGKIDCPVKMLDLRTNDVQPDTTTG